MSDPFAEIKAAIAAGDEERARQLLRDQIRTAPSAEAYYLASQVAYTDDQAKMFLENALEIDPFHSQASQALKAYRTPPPAARTAAPAAFGGLPDRKAKEQTTAGQELADPGLRLVAYIIDAIVLAVIGLLAGFCFGIVFAFSGAQDTGLLENLSLLIGLVINAGYHVYFLTARDGQTPGKSAMRIRVVKKDGSPITGGDAFLRSVIGYFISGVVFALGFIWILIDQERQGWHDKIAQTIVVRAE